MSEIVIRKNLGAWKLVYVDNGIDPVGFYNVNAGDPKTYSPASAQTVLDALSDLVGAAQPQPAPAPGIKDSKACPFCGCKYLVSRGAEPWRCRNCGEIAEFAKPYAEYKAAAERLANMVLEPQGSANMGTFFPPPVSLELRRLAAIVAAE